MGSQPSPIEQDEIAEVTYAATLMEMGSPQDKVQGPVFTGHGIVTATEGTDFDPDAPQMVLHLGDGRSVPIEIEARVRDRGYRFQVVSGG